MTSVQIDGMLDRLDPNVSYRVYVTYNTGTESVECVTRQDFRMRQSHLKSISWLLAIRNPIKISFDSDEHASVDFTVPISRVPDTRKNDIRSRIVLTMTT
jgi:hypothetical protein